MREKEKREGRKKNIIISFHNTISIMLVASTRRIKSLLTRLKRPLSRPLWTGTLNIEYKSRPTAIFTSGAPGSGKTYSIDRLFGLDKVELLDLDVAMKDHPDFDFAEPKTLYERRDAYLWADSKIEEMFQERLGGGRGRICMDGTGTNVERQIRRMKEARERGFWVVVVYVKVDESVCFERNERRKRKVPRDVIKSYLDRLDGAVEAVLSEDIVDEFISLDNSEDDNKTEEERWGTKRTVVQEKSETNASLFDDSDEWWWPSK